MLRPARQRSMEEANPIEPVHRMRCLGLIGRYLIFLYLIFMGLSMSSYSEVPGRLPLDVALHYSIE